MSWKPLKRPAADGVGGMAVPNRALHGRYASLDVARGCAVLAMIYIHLVPAEGGRTPFERACVGMVLLLEGKAAGLFCVLAGMSWAIQAQRAMASPRWPRYIARRALALAAAGVLLHVLIWPTEILIPLALMMPIALALLRRGRKALYGALLLLLLAAPLLTARFGELVAQDWTDSGVHIADAAPGWATVRCLIYDGNYPLIPWLAFPLLGMLLATGEWHTVNGARRCFRLALPLAVLSQLYAQWAGAHSDLLGGTRLYLGSTWVPTSIPFMILSASWALALIAGLAWRQAAAGLPRFTLPLAQLGRASLTHYLLHICVAYALLRRLFPEDDWPVRVGLGAFLLYVALALPLTTLWLRRFARGPLESLWAAAAGPLRET